MKYTKEKLLDILGNWIDKNKVVPSSNLWLKKGGVPHPSTFAYHFGAWNKGLETLGYKPFPRSREPTRLYQKADVIILIKEWVKKHGELPKSEEWNKPPRGIPSTTTVKTMFGGWNNAIREAGFSPRWPFSKGGWRRTRWIVLKRDNFTCQYCGRSAPDVILNVDHVCSKFDKGEDNPDNLVTACKDCNIGKFTDSL